MKKNLRFLLALAIGWLTSTGAFALDQVEGVYQIGTADELIEFAGIVNGGENGANAVLTANIDMTEKAWTPIGNNDNRYVGTFDGQFHKIDNLVYEGGDKAGIFGVVNGGCVIKNLIAGPGNVIKGTSMIGGIIGASDGSGWVTLEKVGHEGYVEGTGNNCCAIIGVVMNGGPATRILDCYNTGDVTAGGESAIIAGWFGGHGSVEVKGFWNTGKMLSGGANDGKDLWRNNSGITIERIFHLYDAQGAVVIADGDLASGKLAYMLNGNADAGVWHQNLEGDAKDAQPTFDPTHGAVYANGSLNCDGTPKADVTYSNTAAEPKRDDHQWNDWGVCSSCDEIQPDFLKADKDGFYPIATKQDYNWFMMMVNLKGQPNINGKLTQDLDLSDYTFVPIGVDQRNYAGTFDGQGFRIKNMTLDGTKKEQGFFSTCQGGAVIKNLIIDSSCKMVGTGGSNVAALIGCINHNNFNNEEVLIQNVGNEMSFDVTTTNNAGFIARDFSNFLKVKIENCYNTGNIMGGNENGAFTAWTPRVTLTNCWNTGRIEKTGNYDGSKSLARGNQPKFINSYDLNSENTDNAGAPAGYSDEWLASGELCYILNGNQSENVSWFQKLGTDLYPMPFGQDVVYAIGSFLCDGVTPKEGVVASYSNTKGENNVDTHQFNEWGFCSVCDALQPDFMTPATDGAFEIANEKQLNWFAMYVNTTDNKAANARLTADIDFSALQVMIGNSDNDDAYQGTFDGQGHKVTLGYAVNQKNVALFRYLNNALIKNLVTDGTIQNEDNSCSGGIFAGSRGATVIENCVSYVTFNRESGGDATIGGIGAYMHDNGTLRNCAFLGAVNAPNAEGNGGLLGYANGGGNVLIENCLVNASVFNISGNSVSIARNTGNVKNTYVVNCGLVNQDEQIKSTEEQLASGELCFLLNEKKSENAVWYQVIGTDANPLPFVKDGGVVYAQVTLKCDGTEKSVVYANEAAEPVKEDHVFENGFCTACGEADVNNLQITATTPYAGQVAADGDFFIYNVESGLWLQNNEKNTGDWNTRGATGTYGFAFNIKAITGGWQLDPKFGHNHSMNIGNFYLDTGDGLSTWTLQQVDLDGKVAYFIKANDGRMLTLDDNDNLAWDTRKAYVWQLVTRDDRVKYLTETATEENPLDASFLIDDPSFANENERAASWKWEKDGGNTDDVRWYRNRRSYAIWNSNSFKISQTISNVPNGKYALTFKGYYRDGDKDQVVERRAAGEERLIAKYFVNNDKADVMSILDGASATWVEGLFYYPAADAEAPYGHYPDNADGFNRIFQDYPDAYQNKPLESVVTTGAITLGLEKLEANAKDWLAFDDFRLTYLGNAIDLTEFIAGLEKALQDAKAFDASTTSNILAQDLAKAIADGEAALTSTDADVIAAASGAITAALEAAKAVNLTVLRQTLALATTEIPGEFDELVDAIEFIRAASEVDFYTYLLRTARKINALGTEDVFTGSAPEADQEYFLYNIGTGMWLNNGSDWNTHAAIDVYALPITLVAAEDGKYKLKNHAFYRDEQWINWNAYVDTGNQDTWTFNPVEGKENVYTINSEGNRTDVGRLLGYDPFGPTDKGDYWYWSNVTKDRLGVDDANNQWKLVSRAEIDARYANATKDQPVDVSYMIANPGLSRVWDINKWTKECDGGNGGVHITSGDDGDFNRNSDYGYEVWNANSFSFTQKITGLKPGTYEVSVNGFFRQGDGAFQAGVVNNGGDLISEAYLVANDEKAYLPNIATEAGKMPGIFSQDCANGTFANWPKEALAAFQTGLYKASVEVIVGKDGELTIGVKQDEKTTDASWALFDSFRLVYKGLDVQTMAIVGDFTGGWPEGDDWSMAKAMTQDSENPAVWTLEVQDFWVKAEDKENLTYEYKATANNQWGLYEVPADGSNQNWVFGTDEYPEGVYDLLFTLNTTTNELTLVPTFDEVTTSIREMNVNTGANAPIYNLNGQKVDKTRKGLYIQNGRKVVIK